MNLWIDPNKDISTLTDIEKITNEKAAQYVLTNIDVNNMSQITTENEQCFITIWNLLKQFHEPQTVTTIEDFYSNIYNLMQQPECICLSLNANLKNFLKFWREITRIAIMLVSVKRFPEFAQLFYSAKWLKRKNLTLKMVRKTIIAAQDSRNIKRNQMRSAHSVQKHFMKFHRRHNESEKVKVRKGPS